MTTAKERYGEVAAVTRRLNADFPEATRSFLDFMNATEKDGALSRKTKELMNIALAIQAQCEWCIAFHVHNAVRLGATREEMVEAGWQAIVMHGGPAFMYMTPLYAAIDEYLGGEK